MDVGEECLLITEFKRKWVSSVHHLSFAFSPSCSFGDQTEISVKARH